MFGDNEQTKKRVNDYMKLIIGLGNPGKIYVNSRHNIGFSVVESLAKVYKISLKKERSTFSLSGKGKIQGQDVILAMPLTFMNLSGIAVSSLFKKYKIDLSPAAPEKRGLDNVLVICDDLDLESGRLKIKGSGSSGGHRGLNSIIDSIKSQGFCRLRIGMGRPLKKDVDAADYVLSTFTKKEKAQVKEITKRAVECCRVWATEGISKSMSVFNRWSR